MTLVCVRSVRLATMKTRRLPSRAASAAITPAAGWPKTTRSIEAKLWAPVATV